MTKKKKIVLIVTSASSFLLIAILVVYPELSLYLKPWKNYDGADAARICTIDNCYIPEINQKYYYYLDQAVQHHDSSYCDNVDGLLTSNPDESFDKETAIVYCKADYGGKSNDMGYCNEFYDEVKDVLPFVKTLCHKKIAKEPLSLSVCKKFPEYVNDEYIVEYECYTNYATKTKDSSVCNSIPKDYTGHVNGMYDTCLNRVNIPQ